MSKLPKPTRQRLLLLLELLERWEKNKITSVEIASLLGCKDTLVRYDFRFVDVPAGVSNGYSRDELKSAVQAGLGVGLGEGTSEEGSVQGRFKLKNVCIVGLGRIGAALLDDGIFDKSGFKVCAGFDSNVNRVELLRSSFELYPASRIESVLKVLSIEYAFLCCGESEAQKMADRLVVAGIKGIVNYTRTVVKVPENVKVQNVSPVMALKMFES